MLKVSENFEATVPDNVLCLALISSGECGVQLSRGLITNIDRRFLHKATVHYLLIAVHFAIIIQLKVQLHLHVTEVRIEYDKREHFHRHG